MRRFRSNLTVIGFASFLAALVVAESLSKGACQGDWFGGDCYLIGSRTCRECWDEAVTTMGFKEGKCEDTPCEWEPGWVCPTTAGIIFTNNTMTTPCDCNGDDAPGFDAYEVVTDENGDPIQKHCADVYMCSSVFVCEDHMGLHRCRQDVNEPLPYKLYCATYQLSGAACDCGGG